MWYLSKRLSYQNKKFNILRSHTLLKFRKICFCLARNFKKRPVSQWKLHISPVSWKKAPPDSTKKDSRTFDPFTWMKRKKQKNEIFNSIGEIHDLFCPCPFLFTFCYYLRKPTLPLGPVNPFLPRYIIYRVGLRSYVHFSPLIMLLIILAEDY